VVEPALKVDMVADVVDKEVDLVWCPAYDEATAYHHWRKSSVASSRRNRRTACRMHLHEVHTKSLIITIS